MIENTVLTSDLIIARRVSSSPLLYIDFKSWCKEASPPDCVTSSSSSFSSLSISYIHKVSKINPSEIVAPSPQSQSFSQGLLFIMTPHLRANIFPRFIVYIGNNDSAPFQWRPNLFCRQVYGSSESHFQHSISALSRLCLVIQRAVGTL